MSSAKRRKVSATISRNTTSSTRSITAFTKVSKAQVIFKPIYNKIDRLEATSIIQLDEPDRKRKLLPVDEDETEISADQVSAILSFALGQSDREIKALPQRRSKDSQRPSQSPQKPIPTASSQKTPSPTKGTRDLFDSIALSSASPTETEACLGQLPIELRDLINLHSAFLTALSLHHAHNGTHSPADLRLLCLDVARAWGKRRVLLDDIRRTLGVLNASEVGSGLTLSDYGHGKICVESREAVSERSGIMSRPLDENRLNDAFAHELQKLWEARQETKTSISIFIKTLPLEEITICSSLAKMSPLLAKGQRRLEDLRSGIMLKKQAEKESPVKSWTQEDGIRKPTLLERLKAKQLHKSTLPPPPSKVEIGQKAALQRLEEVVSVLCMLTTSTSIGQARVSFTMPTILGKLRDSFKTPMSKEEGDTCVRLLASEIAPEWLRVVKMGKVDAVVVNRDNRPSDLDIKERVKRAD